MIAIFDTSIHVPLLSGHLELARALDAVCHAPVRLSPIVASELLRGVRGESRRSVDKLVAKLLPLEPPSWRRCWFETGRLLPTIFSDHEDVGLARLQNDCLLSLTARHTGALLLSADDHFETIRRNVPFRLRRLPPQ